MEINFVSNLASTIFTAWDISLFLKTASIAQTPFKGNITV